MSDFIYILFMFHHMYIALGRGRQSTGDKILMTIERPFLFAYILQVSKWSLRNLILYTFWQKTPWDKLLMSTEIPYHFDHLLQVSNKYLWILILYIFFNVFQHVYSPRAGAYNLLWTKSWCQQKSLVICRFVAGFKKILLKSDFIHNFSCFYTCIYLRGRGRQPLGSEFLYTHKPFVTLVICCKFLPLNDFLTVFPI